MAHSAVLLAGGKSSRMGRDKAHILVNGEPLWRRQLRMLSETGPAHLWVSGPPDPAHAAAGASSLPDAVQDSGPLGGIAAALSACQTEWLLVLAVDLPAMRTDFLRNLLTLAESRGRGVVPTDAQGHVEPLVAVYPASGAAVAQEHLRMGRFKLTDLIAAMEGQGTMSRYAITPEETALFENWNLPEDIRTNLR